MNLNKSRGNDLANGLYSEISDRLGLDSDSSKSNNDNGGFIRDIKKVGRKVWCFCDFLVKVIDDAPYLFNHFLLYLQIF